MSGLGLIPVSSCVMLKRNPQYLTPHEMESLKRSIQRDGFLVPILVRPIGNDLYEIVSGNHRFMAARELGLAEIPAVVADIDDAQMKRLAVNLNTVHGNPSAELMAPFLADLDDETLKSIHLDDQLMADTIALDAALEERLKELQIPDSWNQQSSLAPLPKQCTCPTCGKTHASAA